MKNITKAGFKRFIEISELKYATYREFFEGVGVTDDYVEVVDGYTAIRVKKPIDFDIPKEANFKLVDKFYDSASKNEINVEVPTLMEVKEFMAKSKEYYKENKCYPPYVLAMENGNDIWVNPIYIRNILEILKSPTIKANDVPTYPLYFEAENGCALLYPIRKKKI